MLTSVQKTSNSKLQLNDQGFTLIEVLVALLLVSLIFLVVPSSDNVQSHRDLKTSMDNIDRAIRFSMNEAVLRNSVVRLRLNLDTIPIEYVVEYGPPGNIPLPELSTNKNLSLKEEEFEKKKKASIDQQFNSVEEFQDIKHEIPETVSIVGMATNTQQELITEGQANIYFYPTGDKDSALIIFSTKEEVSSLEIEAFLSDVKIKYHPLKIMNVDNLEEIIETKVEEIFQNWTKN